MPFAFFFQVGLQVLIMFPFLLNCHMPFLIFVNVLKFRQFMGLIDWTSGFKITSFLMVLNNPLEYRIISNLQLLILHILFFPPLLMCIQQWFLYYHIKFLCTIPWSIHTAFAFCIIKNCIVCLPGRGVN